MVKATHTVVYMHSQVVAAVLQLVVQHADVQLADAARWLQLSKGVRRALQQATGNLEVWGCCRPTAEQLTAFAQWLPSHAGLVNSLNFQVMPHILHDGAFRAAAEQILSLALQFSSSRGAASSSTVPQDVPAPALQLKSFKTNFLFQPAALQAASQSSTLQLFLHSASQPSCVLRWANFGSSAS